MKIRQLEVAVYTCFFFNCVILQYNFKTLVVESKIVYFIARHIFKHNLVICYEFYSRTARLAYWLKVSNIAILFIWTRVINFVRRTAITNTRFYRRIICLMNIMVFGLVLLLCIHFGTIGSSPQSRGIQWSSVWAGRVWRQYQQYVVSIFKIEKTLCCERRPDDGWPLHWRYDLFAS